jgi:hypothetical protein
VKIEADNQTRAATDPLPDNRRKAPFMIRAGVHTNMNEVGATRT